MEMPTLTDDQLLEGIEIKEAEDSFEAEVLGTGVVQDGPQVYTTIAGTPEELPLMFAQRNRFIRQAMEDPRRVSGPGETVLGPVGDAGSIFFLLSYTVLTDNMVDAQDENMVWSNIHQAELSVEIQKIVQGGAGRVAVPTSGPVGGFGGVRG